MKTIAAIKRDQAFTLFEVLIVVAVLTFFAALLLPALRKGGSNKRISCVNNLKQVGLAYRVWSGDNGDKFPMLVSMDQGGSMERALAGDAVLTFQVMSNELSTPKILVCPNDTQRNSATNFTHISRNNISYFVGVDATETNATMFLGGDRNLTTSERMISGLQNITTNQAVRWTSEIHETVGNILLVDGSVQTVSSSALRELLTKTGVANNRLAFP